MIDALIIALTGIVLFGLGVELGTLAGFRAGMLHAIDATHDADISHALLYTTLLDMGDQGVLVLKLLKKEQKKNENDGFSL